MLLTLEQVLDKTRWSTGLVAPHMPVDTSAQGIELLDRMTGTPILLLFTTRTEQAKETQGKDWTGHDGNKNQMTSVVVSHFI
jgi:hypothetical protein